MTCIYNNKACEDRQMINKIDSRTDNEIDSRRDNKMKREIDRYGIRLMKI